jgi:hypothetical protein
MLVLRCVSPFLYPCVGPTQRQDMVTRRASPFLKPGIEALTRRLLKRVKASEEREFVGGKFLLPTTIRYDGQPKAPNEEVRPCTFFNFPYFSLDKHRVKGCKNCANAGKDGHPKRTLLQSRYRLESTAIKDKSQSITTLELEDVAKCLKPTNKQHTLSASNDVFPIIHVPQLWVASLSGGNHPPRFRSLSILTRLADVMLTSGPLHIQELQSSIIRTGPKQRHRSSGPALVRIILDNSMKTQHFTYPSDQCDWWFVSCVAERHVND